MKKRRLFIALTLMSIRVLYGGETQSEGVSSGEVQQDKIQGRVALQEGYVLDPKTVQSSYADQGLFFFLTKGASNVVRGGLSYRRSVKRGFFDVEVSRRVDPIVASCTTVEDGKVQKRIRTEDFSTNVEFYTASIGRAVAASTQYARVYALGGAGVTYAKVKEGSFEQPILPIATLKLGVDFRYGFIDLGVNIPVPFLKYRLAIERESFSYKGVHSIPILQAERIGFGFTF